MPQSSCLPPPGEFRQKTIAPVGAGRSPEELSKLRCELRQVKLERESGRSWQKPRPGSHGRPRRRPEGLRVRSSAPGPLSGENGLSGARRLPERLLYLPRNSSRPSSKESSNDRRVEMESVAKSKRTIRTLVAQAKSAPR